MNIDIKKEDRRQKQAKQTRNFKTIQKQYLERLAKTILVRIIQININVE